MSFGFGGKRTSVLRCHSGRASFGHARTRIAGDVGRVDGARCPIPTPAWLSFRTDARYKAGVGDIKDNSEFWAAYDWAEGGTEWSQAWGATRLLFHGSLYPRIAAFVPTGHLLEIAPGVGRITEFLLPLCDRYSGVDLTEKCVANCRQRYAAESKATFWQNDGASLDMIEDSSVDFAFTWDSLVHADDGALRAYFGELSKKLKPGAFAFMHHSNLGDVLDPAEIPTYRDLHGRDSGMSATKARGFADEAGLHCHSQELMNWGEHILKDCITVVSRPTADSVAPSPQITEHNRFIDETGNLLRVHSIYGGHDPDRGHR